MWQKLKKVEWTANPLFDVVVGVVLVAGLIWILKNDSAQAKIKEFNTVTQTWSEPKP